MSYSSILAANITIKDILHSIMVLDFCNGWYWLVFKVQLVTTTAYYYDCLRSTINNHNGLLFLFISFCYCLFNPSYIIFVFVLY